MKALKKKKHDSWGKRDQCGWSTEIGGLAQNESRLRLEGSEFWSLCPERWKSIKLFNWGR